MPTIDPSIDVPQIPANNGITDVFRTNFKDGISADRYPVNLGQKPFDKFIIFEAHTGRTVGRQIIPEGQNGDRQLNSVALYLNESALKDALTVKYDNNDLGTFVGAAVEYFAQTGEKLFDSTGGQLIEGIKKTNILDSMTSAANSLKKVTGDFGSKLGEGAVDAIKADALNGLNDLTGGGVTALTGKRPNPRTSVIFDTANYREHHYEFLLVPRSQQEADAIDRIINFFQFYMLPSYNTQTIEKQLNIGSFMIGVPYEFVITYYSSKDGQSCQTMEHINKPERSVLQSVEIDHAAGGKTAFVRANGEYYPVATALRLSFQEIILLSRDSDKIQRPGGIIQNANTDPRGA